MCVTKGGSGSTASMALRSSPSTTGCAATSSRGRSASTSWMPCWPSSRKRSKEMKAVTSSGSAVVTLPTDTQILITREFNAPRRLVYQAWTTPELIKRWWSADRGEMTIAEVDLRVGGAWRYVMSANGGFEVAFHGQYREVVPNERIVSTEIFEAMPEAAAVSTVTFAEQDGRTVVSILVQHASQEHRDGHINSGMEDGLQEALDYLEQIAVSLS